MKHLRILFLCAVIVLMVLPTAEARVWVEDTVVISEAVDDDVYLAGRSIVINERIAGDALAAGGTLTVNAAVEQDLIIAGGSILIDGSVGDDLRAAGGEITVSESVADDLVVTGGSVTISRGVTVGGDVLAAAGRIVIDGQIEGNVHAAGGEIIFNGEIRGRADFRSGEKLYLNGAVDKKTVLTASKMTLGPDARLGSGVDYWLEEGEFDFGPALVSGPAVFKPELRPGGKEYFEKELGKKTVVKIAGAWFAFSFLSGALFILIMVLLAPNFFVPPAESVRDSFWKNAGLGVLYFVLTPGVIISLFITVIGLPIGFFLLFLYLFSLFFAKIFTALVLARWFEVRKSAKWGVGTFFFAGLGIFLVLKLLTFVPILGWIAAAVFICAAYGGFMITGWAAVRRSP